MGTGFWQGAKAKTEIDPYGTLNPEQKTMFQTLAPKVTDLAANGAPTYTGNFTTPYTSMEQDNLNRQNALSGQVADWSGNFQPGQINAETDANELRNLNQQFYGNGATPGAKALAEEQYAGSGGYWGSARAGGVMDAYNNTVSNPYQNWRSTALQNSYKNALDYANGASSINQATATMAAAPRLIQQYGLDKQYDEWTRGQNMNKSYIDSALNFLNISTKTSTYTPAVKSGFQAFTEALGAGGLGADLIAGNNNWDATAATGRTINQIGTMALTNGMNGSGSSNTSTPAYSSTPTYNNGYNPNGLTARYLQGGN
jgi:hypothetical protein